MTDKDFMQLMEEYLATQKVFIQNPERIADVRRATEIAVKLFPDAIISINEDPIQMGAMILRIEDFDVTIRGAMEIDLFQSLISKADNFEIYPIGDEKVRFAMVFEHALIKL